MEHDARNNAGARTHSVASQAPAPRPQTTLCPYCGHVSASAKACERCRGVFEPLSRQASQNAMGPWFIRDESNPFLPGFSLATLRQMVRRGRITPDTIIKGPSTRQFWAYARSVPGVAHLLGACHVCRATANADLTSCSACGASFDVPDDREHLGLTPVRLLPGQADPAQIAAAGASGVQASAMGTGAGTVLSIVSQVGPEIDAAALISARQRQRRAQRRRTVGLIVLVVVLVGLGAAVAALLSRGHRPVAKESATPPTPAKSEPPLNRTGTGENASPDGEAVSEPTAVEVPAPATPPEVREPGVDDLQGRLVTANLDDLAQVIEEAQGAIRDQRGGDGRLAGAIASAQQRLAIARAARRF